jgi:transcriptional regulator with XRE-family HTH domain
LTVAPPPRGTEACEAAGRSPPLDVDSHVGARVRDRRVILGLTQQQLAELIGVTYQQAHKYEKGINRISAGRLYTIAQALGVPVSHFYEGLLADSDSAPSTNQRMLLELARNFLDIRDRRNQEAVVSLARALADTEGDKGLAV